MISQRITNRDCSTGQRYLHPVGLLDEFSVIVREQLLFDPDAFPDLAS